MLNYYIALALTIIGIISIISLLINKKRYNELKSRGLKATGYLIKLRKHHSGNATSYSNRKSYAYQGVYTFKAANGNDYIAYDIVHDFTCKYGDVENELSLGIEKEILYLERNPKVSKLVKYVKGTDINITTNLSIIIVLIVTFFLSVPLILFK